MAAGASCIYSLLGAREYSWRFIASDIDELALQHAEELVAENDLKQQIVLSHLAELKNWCHGEHFFTYCAGCLYSSIIPQNRIRTPPICI